MWRVVVVNVVVVVGLLFALEIGVRLFLADITPVGTDSRLFADSLFGDAPGPRPFAVGTSNGARFRVDARGFWTYAVAADTSGHGWLFLGDSVTMGIGVEPDSTFAGRLAARLDTVRILNPSVIGYSSRDYSEVLNALTNSTILPLRIERVTVFWCLNDVYGGAPGLADPDDGVRQLGGALLTFIRRHFFTYQWWKTLFFDRPRTYYEHDRRLYAGSAFNDAVKDLQRLQALSAARGLSLEVVLLPYEYQLRAAADPEVFLPQDMLRERLVAAGIRVYDPSEYLLSVGEEPKDMYLFGDGIHFSTRGHSLLTEYLARTLR